MVVDPESGEGKLDDVRTSWGMFLDTAETPMVKAIEERVAEWAQVPVRNQEQLQVLRYGLGQQYSEHYDSFEHAVLDKDPRGNSQRCATVLMFLSQVEEGGETVFPQHSEWASDSLRAAAANFSSACAKRGPAVHPRAGDAILFWSLDLNGKEDTASMHASCPVIRGQKWTATKWMHQTEFKL